MLEIRARVVALADAELTNRLTASLNPGVTFLDEQQLPANVAVPGGPGTGLEGSAR
jgi:hypothetical protein